MGPDRSGARPVALITIVVLSEASRLHLPLALRVFGRFVVNPVQDKTPSGPGYSAIEILHDVQYDHWHSGRPAVLLRVVRVPRSGRPATRHVRPAGGGPRSSTRPRYEASVSAMAT